MPRVYNFFRYRVRDDATAEDLTSTTFLRAWRARDRYSSDLSAFTTWIFSIAANVAIDYWRRQRTIVPLDDLFATPDDLSVEEISQQHDNSARLNRLLAELPSREQELIALKYGAELTNRAIAGILGMSESNVGTTLHRIVGRLRQGWDS
ncbi:MAG: sigma-70 family RNA polymerase sigma factor [Pleurocapsa minor GSE-CHR-MK-17-07R]|jgi:RNA polymerase sigma-70 factor (ECF subfamily)|nr:sigma-70 family RNA polymerase sigma factor [Pleurocapsa minor GSE-CHR-MK 17-07R]